MAEITFVNSQDIWATLKRLFLLDKIYPTFPYLFIFLLVYLINLVLRLLFTSFNHNFSYCGRGNTEQDSIAVSSP